MKRTTIALLITFGILLSSACASGNVTGTVAGTEVTLDSQRRTKEFKPPGSGTGYGQMSPFAADGNKEFLVIELKAPKKLEFGDKGIKALVKDDKGQTYKSIYSQVLGFDNQRTEAKLLFEVPQQSKLSTLMLDETSFDLSKVKTSTSKD